jgi:hypothetical protein
MNFRPPNASGDGRDPRITNLLRAAYRAPDDPAYWGALEARIVARVLGADARPTEWWDAFAGWTRAGLLAAGVVAAIALAAAFETRAEEARVAYEAVVEAPPLLAGQRAVRAASARLPRADAREATLRYVIAH